jgi:PPE-repeat protein
VPGEWGTYPPEINSAGFWLGPGTGSFYEAAATLEALVALLAGILGGTEAAAGAQMASWDSVASLVAMAAHLPYQAWIGDTMAHLMQASAMIAANAQGFDSLKAATPTPGEIEENQIENVILNQLNFLGMLTPAIAANRAEYGRKWVTAAGNMYSYEALSGTTVQTLAPLDPPIPSGMPAAAPGVPDAAQPDSGNPLQALTTSGGPGQGLSAFMPLLSQLASAPSQLAQGGGGSQLLSGFTQLPQQAMGPLQSIMGQFTSAGALGGFGAADPAAAAWIAATPAAGGPVSAALSGGGAGVGGLGGGGISSVAAGLRGPASWSSTVAASPGSAPESAAMSRIAEARGAPGTTPAMATSMASPGAMMAPLAHGAHGQEKGKDAEPKEMLLTAATLYRAPEELPVVTGAGGAHFGTGEEEP